MIKKTFSGKRNVDRFVNWLNEFNKDNIIKIEVTVKE